MQKTSLIHPIFYTLWAAWETYRFISRLAQIYEQAQWLTVADILFAVALWGVAIYHWVIYAKGKPKNNP